MELRSAIGSAGALRVAVGPRVASPAGHAALVVVWESKEPGDPLLPHGGRRRVARPSRLRSGRHPAASPTLLTDEQQGRLPGGEGDFHETRQSPGRSDIASRFREAAGSKSYAPTRWISARNAAWSHATSAPVCGRRVLLCESFRAVRPSPT